MTRFLGAAFVVGCLALGASTATAQNVGMAGEYSEANGIIINIPQNPPNVDCAADQAAWDALNDARCPRRLQNFFGGTSALPVFNYPHHGNYGARLGTATSMDLPAPTANGPRAAGLNVGDPFRLPANMMQQRLGTQVGIVLNNAVRQLDTTFTAVAPGTARVKNPPANTRIFAASGWVGQDDGLSGPTRTAAAQTVTRVVGSETLTLTYTPGPNAFGGTMTALLDGTGRLYIRTAGLDAGFPPSLVPVVASNPVGDGVPGLAERNGAGWNYTIAGGQDPGHAKGFGIYPTSVQNAIIAVDCAVTPPATPPGCNEINFWETPFPSVPSTGMNPVAASVFNGAPGVHFGLVIPGATSTKHAFAWTTGEVRIQRVAVRSFGTVTDTVTGRGYDTTTTDGGVDNRNVGMVAGSYTIRTSVSGVQMNTQMIGIDLSFTPEPGASVALLSGLGLLGGLAARRRR